MKTLFFSWRKKDGMDWVSQQCQEGDEGEVQDGIYNEDGKMVEGQDGTEGEGQTLGGGGGAPSPSSSSPGPASLSPVFAWQMVPCITSRLRVAQVVVVV